MNCERARELFSEYHEEGVDVALVAVVRGHLNQCPDCSREFEAFKHTWAVLDRLPEIEIPRGLRHDVVMRAARDQHERIALARGNALRWDAFIGRLVPMRGVAVAAAVAALALILLRIPESAYVHFTSMFSPKVEIGQTVKMSSDAGTSALRMDSSRKQEWLTRKLSRNTVWISVTPRDNGDGSMVYRVMLTINTHAFLPDEAGRRIGAEVHLLPANRFDYQGINAATSVWSGNILDNSPVLVPVIVDRTQGKEDTVNLLVTWNFQQREFGQIVMIPTQRTGRPGDVFDFSAKGGFATSETGLYPSLQIVAQEYGVPVVANAYLTESPAAISSGRGDLNDALSQLLRSTELDWLVSDGVVYVDRQYGSR